MLLRVICVAVLLIILTAGLWPFHAPRNKVSWLSGETGLRFEKYASVVSLGEFKASPFSADDSCAIEIWVQPKRLYSAGTILSFYRPESHVSPLAIRQSWGNLELEKAAADSQPAQKIRVLGSLLTPQKPVLLSIVSNSSGTAVYSDGVLFKQLPRFRFTHQNLTGRLLLGNSPFTTQEWMGELKGVAIYHRALTPEQVAGHYTDWTKSNHAALTAEHPAALYFFDEHAGEIAHNRVDSSTDLVIPARFFILHELFLERPWDEYRPNLRYWKDIAINIAGFLPLGFFFFPYFSLTGGKYRLAATVAFGFAVSLTIEVLQSFLPTRDSGMTDLITNTLGTAIGVFFFRFSSVQWALAVLGIVPQNAAKARAAEPSACEMVSAGGLDSAK